MGICTHKKRKKKKPLVISAILLLFVGIYVFLSLYVKPVIRTVSQEEVRSLTIEYVNNSVSEVMRNNPEYVDMTEIIKDDSGNIAMIHANSSAINSLARNITEKAQNYLSMLKSDGINIPLGSLSGIAFFAGRGPDINIKALPVGNIDTSFSSEFIPAGINQTLHKLFIDVTASVSIIIPGAENKVTTVTKVLVSESIIIGKVPDAYLGNQSVDVTYDLVP